MLKMPHWAQLALLPVWVFVVHWAAWDVADATRPAYDGFESFDLMGLMAFDSGRRDRGQLVIRAR